MGQFSPDRENLLSGISFFNIYDWDSSVPLYGNHLKKWQTGSRDWEQNTQKRKWFVMEFHVNWAHVNLCLNLSKPDSDWPVSMYSVKNGRHAVPCTMPYGSTHCTALRESTMHWSLVERESIHVYVCAHFWNCLFIMISTCIWIPSQGPCDSEDLDGISLWVWV